MGKSDETHWSPPPSPVAFDWIFSSKYPYPGLSQEPGVVSGALKMMAVLFSDGVADAEQLHGFFELSGRWLGQADTLGTAVVDSLCACMEGLATCQIPSQLEPEVRVLKKACCTEPTEPTIFSLQFWSEAQFVPPF